MGTAPFNIMQSSGGLVPAALAGANPALIIESGPAAGVVGCRRLGEQLGSGDLIVLDMGGTTAKASIIRDGELTIMPQSEVGGGALMGNRLLQGAGYPVLGSDYWPHLNMDRQVNIYYMVQSQNPDRPVTTILYDVTRRPGIRPKAPTKKDVADWPMYYGEEIDLEEPPERETAAMYGARLTADMGERTEFYFARREIGILESHTKDTQRDTWEIHLAILASENRGYYRRATRSCFDHGRCPYFTICSAGVDVTEAMPEGFHHEEPHSELED